MFTGLVAETGQTVSFTRGPAAWRLVVTAGSTLAGVAPGDSIAVNGCCLTVVAHDDRTLAFDLLEETRRLTNFRELGAGAPVNLEASLRVGDKLGGHFVSGHIDGVGAVVVREQRGADTLLRVAGPPGSGRHVVPKGSIAINGVSLTIAEIAGDTLDVWLIPTTLAVTNLRALQPGDPVNLEFDLLGKYVEKLVGNRFS